MSVLPQLKTYLIIISILALTFLLFACSNPSQLSSLPDEPAAPPVTAIALSDNATIETQDNPLTLPERVDVVYFHRPQRCPSCLCFEERVRYVVTTYFQNDINTGKMTFAVYDIGDSKNADIVNKYGAVGSQLFINTVNNGRDNIKDIQDIWSWNCRNNKPGFDQQVKNVIEQSLNGVE
jgi:hypothetical protein